MEPEVFSDYVCYDINSYYHEHPYGPNRCPLCAGDLSQAEMEPSKAMRAEIVAAGKLGVYVNNRATFLLICNKCRWWCIRDACEFVDPSVAVWYHRDYLIFAITEKNDSNTFRDTFESTQPWLKALDNPDVYDGHVVRRLPKELAVFIYKQPDLPGSTSVSQPTIKDLSKYDPFLGMTKKLIARKRQKQSHKAERLTLHPGDRVRITEHVYKYGGPTLIASRWSIAIVLSYEEYLDAIRIEYSSDGLTSWAEYVAGESNWLASHLPLVKKMIEEGMRYPVKIKMVAPPSQAELAFWRETYAHTLVDCKTGEIGLVDVDCLEKIID